MPSFPGGVHRGTVVPLLTQAVDRIAATLAHRERIAAFEAGPLARQPWLARMFPS